MIYVTDLHMCVYITDNNDTTPLPLRLVSGSNEQEGRIEMLYYGVWGTVCDTNFGINSANVACRRLGFPGALRASTSFPYVRAQVWLDNVRCIGNETGLEQCSHEGIGNRLRSCYYYDDAGVVCIGTYVRIYVHTILNYYNP